MPWPEPIDDRGRADFAAYHDVPCPLTWKEEEEIWNEAYATAFREAMAGAHKVWGKLYGDNCRDYDATEDADYVYQALGDALRQPGISPEQIGMAMLRAAAWVANGYAEGVAQDAVMRA